MIPLEQGRIKDFLEGGGGTDFQKLFENFDDLFLKIDQIDFASSPNALKRRCFSQIFCASGKFLKILTKSRFQHLLEFFLARVPPEK